MFWKAIVFSLLAWLSGSCTKRYYGDFSFLKNDGVVIDTSFVPGEAVWTVVKHPYPTIRWSHPSGSLFDLGPKLDTPWTSICQLSTAFDLGFKKYSESDSLFIFYGKDTLLLDDMLGMDTTYHLYFSLDNFYDFDLYRLINIRSGERQLYLSWGHDNCGNTPGSRINFIFPLSQDNRVQGAYAYVTSTFIRETDPCMDCFTDFNRDGKTDFVQWICNNKSPVRYFNISENGQRVYHQSGYKSVYMGRRLGGPIWWGIIRNHQRRYPH